MNFCSFFELLSFSLEGKISDLLLFLLFCLTKQLRYATYGLEIGCSDLGSNKHTYISMVKQPISTLQQCNIFYFSFVLSGEMTKILSTTQRESTLINCQCLSGVYGFLHVYKLTTYLVSLSKNPNKISLFLVSKNCLDKQFTSKFLGTFSTNGSLENVLCSKSILIIVQ